MNRHGAAVHVELAYDRAVLLDLGTERGLGALAQSQQADENVLLGIFVRQEGLPATVGDVVAADQLHLVGNHFVVDLLDADLARSDIAACEAQVLHSIERQLAQVSVLLSYTGTGRAHTH